MLIACGRVGFDAAEGDIASADAAVRCECGDADGNGIADLADVSAVAQQLAGAGAVACGDGADTNLDGRITQRDLNALLFGVTGTVPASAVCGACPLGCGDLDGNGIADAQDSVALDAMLTTPGSIDACLAWAADASGDGLLDEDDRTALAELVAGGPPRCAP